MSAIPTDSELVCLFDTGTLASEMAGRFGLKNHSDIEAVEKKIVALHDAGSIDLLQLVDGGALTSLQGSDFFIAMHFLCQFLPRIETSSARMMRCVEALINRGGEDVAASQPNAAFRAWCANFPERARDVITAARSGDDLASRNLTFALEATADIVEARRMAVAPDGQHRLYAVTALGRIADSDPDSRSATFSVFAQLMNQGSSDLMHANLLHATVEILARSPESSSPESTALILGLLKDAGELIVHAAARVLWAYRNVMNPEIIAGILQVLRRLNPEKKGTVRELDLGLEMLMNMGHDDAAIDFVSLILSGQHEHLALSEFDCFTGALLSGPGERLGRTVVRWLLHGSPALCDGISAALGKLEQDGEVLAIRAEDLQLPPQTQLFLCRKAIGWFFFNPKTAASVLVSVLRVCDEETSAIVLMLLIEALLMNYAGVKEYLERIAADDTAKDTVDRALAQNEEHFSSLHAIPMIKELEPGEHHRQVARQRMSDQMRDIQKRAQNQSVFFGMIKHSVLLYGNRSLSYVKDGGNALRAISTDLKSIGVSFERPRMEILDPIGLDILLRGFRTEKLVS